MRTGNLSSLSERDWAAIKERRAFEQAEREKQVLAEDQLEYEKYVQIVEEDQRRIPPAHRIQPVPFESWKSYADPAISESVIRGAQATNKALLSKVRTEETAQLEAEREEARNAVIAGKPDPSWKIPASAEGLRMSINQAKAYASEQSRLFVEHNPEYFPSAANVAAITKYLTDQTDVVIPNEECFRLAWLRLRELGMIEERPVPAPAAPGTSEVVPEPSEMIPAETELVDGFDPDTGLSRKFSQGEIWKMDSTTYRKAFRMWTDRDGTDRRPKFTRGRYQ